jgi:hypothetical protein
MAWCLIRHSYKFTIMTVYLSLKLQSLHIRSFCLHACLCMKECCDDGQRLSSSGLALRWSTAWGSGRGGRLGGALRMPHVPHGAVALRTGPHLLMSSAHRSELCCSMRRCGMSNRVKCGVCGGRRVTWTWQIKKCPPQRPTSGGSL